MCLSLKPSRQRPPLHDTRECDGGIAMQLEKHPSQIANPSVLFPPCPHTLPKTTHVAPKIAACGAGNQTSVKAVI